MVVGINTETAIFQALNQARSELRAPVAEFRIVPNYLSGGYMVILISTFELNDTMLDVIMARRGVPADVDPETLESIAQAAMKAAQYRFNQLCAAGLRYVRFRPDRRTEADRSV